MKGVDFRLPGSFLVARRGRALLSRMALCRLVLRPPFAPVNHHRASLGGKLEGHFCAWSDNQVAPEAFTLFRCDGLLLGALVALTADHVTQYSVVCSWWCSPLCLVGILIALAACIFEKRLLTIPQLGITFAWAALLLLIVRRPEWPVRRVFEYRLLTSLGKYSYAIYIFQSPLIPMTRPAWETSVAKISAYYPLTCDMLYLVFMSALSYSLAVVSWYVLEKAMLQLRDRLTSNEPDLSQSKLVQACDFTGVNWP